MIFSDVSPEALIGIVSSLAGVILGWALNVITNSMGRIDISCDHASCDFYDITRGPENKRAVSIYENPQYMELRASLMVTNTKSKSAGLNNCKIYAVCGDRKFEYIDLYSSEYTSDNLEELLNILPRYTKEIHYNHHTVFEIDPDKLKKNGLKLILQYRINGKKKIHKKILYTSNYQ